MHSDRCVYGRGPSKCMVPPTTTPACVERAKGKRVKKMDARESIQEEISSLEKNIQELKLQKEWRQDELSEALSELDYARSELESAEVNLENKQNDLECCENDIEECKGRKKDLVQSLYVLELKES